MRQTTTILIDITSDQSGALENYLKRVGQLADEEPTFTTYNIAGNQVSISKQLTGKTQITAPRIVLIDIILICQQHVLHDLDKTNWKKSSKGSTEELNLSTQYIEHAQYPSGTNDQRYEASAFHCSYSDIHVRNDKGKRMLDIIDSIGPASAKKIRESINGLLDVAENEISNCVVDIDKPIANPKKPDESHFFEFDDDLNDLFIEFLESNGWKFLFNKGFPLLPLDCEHYTYEKDGAHLTLEMEHWHQSIVRGNKSALQEVEANFTAFNDLAQLVKTISQENVFKAPENVDFVKKMPLFKQIGISHLIYLVLLTGFFIFPLVLWLFGRSSISTFEVILSFLIIVVYFALCIAVINAAKMSTNEKRLHLDSLNLFIPRFKNSVQFRPSNIKTRESTQQLRNNLFSSTYSKSFSNTYSLILNEINVHLGDLEVTITRRVNGKVGSQLTSEKSFILIETTNDLGQMELNQTKELLDFISKNLDLNLKMLEILNITGVVNDKALIVYFDNLIKNPKVKLIILRSIEQQLGMRITKPTPNAD